jgi:hypothetical protein
MAIFSRYLVQLYNKFSSSDEDAGNGETTARSAKLMAEPSDNFEWMP